MVFWSNRSILSCFKRAVRRSLVIWAAGAYRRGTRVTRSRVAVQDLDARIAARVAREKAQGRYDYVEPVKRAAVKRNGGLRGSTATRWKR